MSGENDTDKLSPVTSSNHLSFDKETATRFDKTSAVLSQRNHNFSAEYELGFRDRNDGKSAAENPYKTKLARDRWQRGWNARDQYTDSHYKWVEPVTESKFVVWGIMLVVLVGSLVMGYSK